MHGIRFVQIFDLLRLISMHVIFFFSTQPHVKTDFIESAINYSQFDISVLNQQNTLGLFMLLL